ncbi:alpha/beta hydrolase [Azospirillum sp.]|uniref:alpha/beta fold hydrolase n=1 Tax=Azospirillum sp. TaxID=34012 RepID=UPI002D6A70FC|nr:alpha/beta hydrolase [Azospirillum sp.]HYD71121.1 alpha/beta hydrolase [Azospirillum sp.]
MVKLSEAATSKFAKVGDLDLHYNEAGDGEVVVMLHGSGPGASGWGNFHRNIDYFVDAGYRVILLDQPGFNKSSEIVVTEPRDVHHARVLRDFLDVLGIGRAHVVGNSMGGAVSLSFALEYPDRIAKQVLIGAGGVGSSVFYPHPAEGIRHLLNLYREPSRENLERMLEVFVYDPGSITKELFNNRLENLRRSEKHCQNFVASVEAVSGRIVSDHSARLPAIKADTLITWGSEDRFVPLDFGLRLVKQIPSAQLHVFNKCGHWGQWEKADLFNRLVVDFLKH